MSSSKVCKTAVESREEVRKEGTREDERREEGGQGVCELAPPGQLLSLPACPPGLAGCSLEKELEELPKLETKEELRKTKRWEVFQGVAHSLDEVVARL